MHQHAHLRVGGPVMPVEEALCLERLAGTAREQLFE
jgi:hypothetical protein